MENQPDELSPPHPPSVINDYSQISSDGVDSFWQPYSHGTFIRRDVHTFYMQWRTSINDAKSNDATDDYLQFDFE